jgi:hypothetical protein
MSAATTTAASPVPPLTGFGIPADRRRERHYEGHA